jgi:hypothetical protein
VDVSELSEALVYPKTGGVFIKQKWLCGRGKGEIFMSLQNEA